MDEVVAAIRSLGKACSSIGLMQCNTNYTGSLENFRYINLRVLETYRLMFPDVVLGLSDHTPGHATVLGAVALGARLIEKHFTDDKSREGPDHPFSMTPKEWRDMVDRTRELELALGSAIKDVADNERQTVVVQRRCLRASIEIPEGTVLEPEMLEPLRPAPTGSFPPSALNELIGRKTVQKIQKGQHITSCCISSV
jgi:sialic acid synthase SpsE